MGKNINSLMKIKLYTPYYQDSLPERHQENLQCFKNNLANSNIDEIYLFVEDLLPFQDLQSEKVRLVKTKGPRCTYADFIAHANSQSDSFILLMANTDIYFDQSLQLLRQTDLNNRLLCLARREVFASGKSSLTEHHHSSDAWIVQTPVRDFFCDVRLGTLHCESYFLGFAQRAGYKIENVGLSIAAYHLHITQKRNYNPNVDRYADLESMVFPALGALPHELGASRNMPEKPTVIDGNAFQLGKYQACRVWLGVLPELLETGAGKEFVILNRVNTFPPIPGVNYVDCGYYNQHLFLTSQRVNQNICDQLAAGTFVSTYYSSVLNTPSLLLIYDLIPEQVNANRENSIHKHLALDKAGHILVFSRTVYNLLLQIFPQIPKEKISSVKPGVSHQFERSSVERVNQFRQKYALERPYLLLVGERTGEAGYANAEIVFKALASHSLGSSYQVVCVGGKPELEPQLANYLSASQVKCLALVDSELIDAYSGAQALVYPQAAAGIGLSVLEAMRCKCPVIAANNPVIEELHADHVLYFDGFNTGDFWKSLEKLGNADWRSGLIDRAYQHALKFTWQEAAKAIINIAGKLKQTNPKMPESLSKELKFLP